MPEKAERIVSNIDEDLITSGEHLVQNVSGAVYLKFPKKFKDLFDIKSAVPILATQSIEERITKLTFVFSNDTLRIK